AAFGILIARNVYTTSSDNRAKASYSPLNQCLTLCDSLPKKAAGVCKLDCPKLIAGTMTCEQICSNNDISHGQVGACINICKSHIQTGGSSISAPRNNSIATPPYNS